MKAPNQRAPLPGGQLSIAHGANSLRFNPDGRVASVRAVGMTISYPLLGGRTIMSEQNGRTLVSTGPQSGYMQRPYFSRNGQNYYERTYVAGGRPFTRLYRAYDYRGVRYYEYVPASYYQPAFYAWASNPWPAPAYYDWGWGTPPWFYGGYFAPAPYYPSASLWLTDFLLAEDLKWAYAAKAEAAARAQTENPARPQGGAQITITAALSPEVKEMINAEVRRLLAEERDAAQSPQVNAPAGRGGNEAPPAALAPTQRLFVVSDSLSVATAGGQVCSLNAGDVLIRIDDNPTLDNEVRVRVMSSKPSDCIIGIMPLVAVTDLQEMHNRFREQLDSGLHMLAEKSGTGGLPRAPDTQTIPGEVPPPTPDAAVADRLQALQVQADQAEYDAADRALESGDLNGALALFQLVAQKPGPMQAQAQGRAQQVTQLIANANRPGRGMGTSTYRPREGLEPRGNVHAGPQKSAPRPAAPSGPAPSPRPGP